MGYNDKIKLEFEFDAEFAKETIASVEKGITRIGTAATKAQTAAKDAAQGIAILGGTAGVIAAAANKLAEMSAEADRSARAFDLLGASYAQVERATNGAVSAQVALRAQQSLVQSGLRLTGEQLGTVTRAAREYALATGTETTQAVEQLTDALRGGETEGLRRFGITLNDTGDRARNFTQAVDTLAASQRGQAASALTATENLERFRTGLSHLANESASFVAGAGTRLLDWWGRFTGGAGSTFSDLVREVGEAPGVAAANRRTPAVNAEQERRAAAQRAAQQRALRVFPGGILPDNVLSRVGPRRLTPEMIDALVRRADPITGDLTDASIENYFSDYDTAPQIERTRANSRAFEAQQALLRAENLRKKRIVTPGRAGGGSGGGGTRAARVDNRQFGSVDEIFANLRESIAIDTAHLMEVASNAHDTRQVTDDELSSTLGRLASGRTMTDDANSDRSRRRSERNRRNSEMARLSTVGGRIQEGLGASSDFLATQAKLTDDYANMAVGAFGRIGNAMIEHIALVIQGKETLGEALLSGANQVSTALAMEAAPKALMELAAGFAALANPITAATAPLHFTAAGIYGGVAAGAGLVSLGTGAAMASAKAPSGAGAADTRRSSSLAPRSSSQSSQNAAPVTINVSSLIPPGPRELQTLAQAVKQSDRYGLNKQSPRPVRV